MQLEPRQARIALVIIWLLALVACGPPEPLPPLGGEAIGAGEVVCRQPRTATLPEDLREVSGLALSRRHPGVLWGHNDSGGEPVLYAIDTTGVLRSRIGVTGARLEDWEDAAVAPCPEGTCVYIADTGDNEAARRTLVVYRIPEPPLDTTATEPAIALRFRYPDGPRDAEALAVTADGDLLVVTRGRHGRRGIYRVRPRPDDVVVALPLLDLGPPPGEITAADLSPDGRWLGIRSGDQLRFFRRSGGALEPVGDPAGIDLRPLREAQGEALAVSDDGTVYLGSEAGGASGTPIIGRIECALPAVAEPEAPALRQDSPAPEPVRGGEPSTPDQEPETGGTSE